MTDFKGCKPLELLPGVTRLLLPDNKHEISFRIFGDIEVFTVRDSNTLQCKQSFKIRLDDAKREDLRDTFFEMALKKYPRQLRHRSATEARQRIGL